MNLRALIDRLAPVAYPTMREEYRPDCCIAAAAILIRVFKECGYEAEPVPVTVEVYNEAMVKLLESGNPLPSDLERKRLLLDLTGAWGVAIAPADTPVVSPLRDQRRPLGGGYGGHLLLRVNEYLIDATIQQAERPEYQIKLPPMIVACHAERLMRDGKLFLEVGTCHVVYRRITDESYREATDWKRTKPFRQTVNKILQRIGASHGKQ